MAINFGSALDSVLKRDVLLTKTVDEKIAVDPIPTVTHKRTNADRQRDYRNAHGDEIRNANAARMAVKRGRKAAIKS